MKASSSAGPERFVLALALLVPLVLGGLALAQLPGASLGSPTSLLLGDGGPNVVRQRPAPSNATPPPTLVPPTPTVRPAAAPVSTATAAPTVEPTPEPTVAPKQQSRTYVVQRGDELRNIAAQYQVNIWKIINNNDIPNPDSLRVGQVLTIPDD
jgi:nucleoid-associated protein YgaU